MDDVLSGVARTVGSFVLPGQDKERKGGSVEHLLKSLDGRSCLPLVLG